VRDIVPLVVAALALAVVLGATVALLVAGKRLRPLIQARQRAIAALCSGRGLTPNTGSADFALLGRIADRWLTNSYASPDHSVAVADFTRPAGRSMVYFTVIAFEVAGVNVPFMSVTRRGVGGVTLGGPPAVELESIDFDQRFEVKARDSRSAVMLLDLPMLQFLLDCETVNFDMVGNKVLAYIDRAAEPAHRPAEPVEFELLLRFMDGFTGRVPALLRSEYAAEHQESL
jgi:hypothetical protein